MINTWSELENIRQENQCRIDALRNAQERNRLGQFATPFGLASQIAEYATSFLNDLGEPIRFLDPAIGSGAFYSAIRARFPDKTFARSVGIEIDPAFADFARSIWDSTGLEVIKGDFTKQELPSQSERFNLIIANPPYVRHHHINPSDKERLMRTTSVIAGTDVNGLTGLYCYFLLLCHNWLAENGLGIWLIPSEFMDVNYGSAVRKYLTSKVSLLHIHRFLPSDVQFADALVSSVVVVYRKSPTDSQGLVRFSYGGELLHPDAEHMVSVSELARANKWTQFSLGTSSDFPGANSGPVLGDLFSIKRGIATGANSFFILPREFARQHNFPQECIKPILPSPRKLDELIVEADDFGYPLIDEQLSVIDSSYPEAIIKTQFPDFWDYLQTGKERGIHETYLTSRRSPWYCQEQRPVAPFVCTYMGRISSNGNAFRFIWNRSQATAPNVYLLLYPKGILKDALEDDPTLYPKVLAILQGIDFQELVRAGRVYGGGLHKLEPRELARVSAEALMQAIGAKQILLPSQQHQLAMI